MRHGTLAAFLIVCSVAPASAKRAAVTVYVDCARPPGGDGSSIAPLPTITAALPIARQLSVANRVTIDVASGECAAETLPMRLDFPVRVRGHRRYETDAGGLPTGDQGADTLITWTPPVSTDPAAFRRTFFEIVSSEGVEIEHLSIDGKRPPGPNVSAAPTPAPIGIIAALGSAFDIEGVRLAQLEYGIRSAGGSGRIRECHLHDLESPITVHGALPDETGRGATVVVSRNRVAGYRGYGTLVAAAGLGGTHLEALYEENDFDTHYTRTGPSNPAGLRIAPGGLAGRTGVVRATFVRNRIGGAIPYPIQLHAQHAMRLDGVAPPTGELRLRFEDNVLGAPGQGAPLITFTHARATELPCELDPASVPATCPTLRSPIVHWDYLEGAVYEAHHGGELDGARIDHPELDPIDGNALGNRLLLNDEVVPYQTFVVVP